MDTAALERLDCPNCGSDVAKVFVLTVDLQLPDNPGRHLHVAHCPACDARFYDSQEPPDYAEPGLNDRGRVPFYVQQGAGVSLITRPLAQTRFGPGATYMEVGCGYGFGLDFAVNTRGWRGRGIDPAPLAALGREAMHLPIELRYLRDDDEVRGTMDVVMGSEVIEHVTSPTAFVRTLRAMLRPEGLLVLTTPNGEDIRPDTADGVIIPLLSPSLHLVIQTSASLHWLLGAAGFAHVQVNIDSHSLVAFASDSPLDLEHDSARLRAVLCDHLEHRAAALAATGQVASDPLIGFAGRAFQESVNDAMVDAADRMWALIQASCLARYGLDVGTLEALPHGVGQAGLEEMARLMPLNLAGLIYAHSVRQFAAGVPRAALNARFRLAAAAAVELRRALGELAMEDGQTEDIGWTALGEAILCSAAQGVPDIMCHLAALPEAPDGLGRRRAIVMRALGELVAAGHDNLARQFAAETGLSEATGVATSLELDTHYFLAQLDLDAAPRQAASRFAQLRAHAKTAGPLWCLALRRECEAWIKAGDPGAASVTLEGALDQALVPLTDDLAWQQEALATLVNTGHLATARRLVKSTGLDCAPFVGCGVAGALSPAERDTVFFLALLDIEIGSCGQPVGNPAAARARFVQVRAQCTRHADLWWAALRGELQALDLLGSKTDATVLVRAMMVENPAIVLPYDIAARI